MGIWTLLGLSIGLASDAFAVSLGFGMAAGKHGRLPVEAAAVFGLFQGLMPLIGYGITHLFAGSVQAVGHWVAFLLLSAIGIKMIGESLGEEAVLPHNDRRTLLFLAFATSMDALAVGASLAVMPSQKLLALPLGIFLCVSVIAVVTFGLCLVGLWLGARAGDRLGNRAGRVGGMVLIGIGIKILLEHLLRL